MAKVKTIANGLIVLLKYPVSGDERDDITAEHDIIYAGGVEPGKMIPEDRKALDELGWEWDEDLECWWRYV